MSLQLSQITYKTSINKREKNQKNPYFQATALSYQMNYEINVEICIFFTSIKKVLVSTIWTTI